MRVLGVDPGLGRTGIAVVEGRPGSLRLLHAGCIETVPQTRDPERLVALMRLLGAVVEEWRPETAAVERLFFSSNRTTAMRVSEARGVALCTLAAAGLGIAEYTPNEVKEAVAGYGGATKRQVLRMSANLLGVASIEGPDDAADACAVAVCHHHRAALGGRIAGRPVPAHGTGVAPALEAAVAAARARAAR